MTAHDRYSSPLAERYASRAMLELWSPQMRHGLWRRLWLALAESEQQLGVPIPDEAIAQMRAHLDDIDFEAVATYERRFRHDVMAHVHAFGDVAPAAHKFIHLGATSAFVTDNADLIIMRRGLVLLRGKVIRVLRKLDQSAPHHVLLVLDATTGQNALNQVEVFKNKAGVTGLVMTKLDGTAKGGILVAISAKFGLPVHAIGVGEGVEDLAAFDAGEFARAVALG